MVSIAGSKGGVHADIKNAARQKKLMEMLKQGIFPKHNNDDRGMVYDDRVAPKNS